MADCPKMTYGGIKYTIWYIANHAGKDVSIKVNCELAINGSNIHI